MAHVGFTLSSEEHGPRRLVELARRAEQVGFEFAMISDHFHPWTATQGESPFVWAVIGGIAEATRRIRIGTGVTCPTTRIHPVIVAQAAATAAAMLPGRFLLGVGTGENLNEHVLGDRWPSPGERLERLEEAIDVIRLLWKGGTRSHRGTYYEVDRARLYTLPDEPPPLLVAAVGPKATALAGRVGDGLVGLSPDADFIRRFEEAGGRRKPRFGQIHVCAAADEAEARRTALRHWPNSGLPGSLFLELPTPETFEKACERVDEETIAASVLCSRDPERHVAAIREYVDAGYDHVYVHQVGPDQEALFRLYEAEVLPRLGVTGASGGARRSA
jgi:coenzyme F420-dependent glucose-6-phosphate dehydrogenase